MPPHLTPATFQAPARERTLLSLWELTLGEHGHTLEQLQCRVHVRKEDSLDFSPLGGQGRRQRGAEYYSMEEF